MKLTQKCFGNISKMLDFYSQFNPSPLSIKQFIDFGECEELALLATLHTSSNSEPQVSRDVVDCISFYLHLAFCFRFLVSLFS